MFRIAALVLFIIAAILLFPAIGEGVYGHVCIAAGLACLAAGWIDRTNPLG